MARMLRSIALVASGFLLQTATPGAEPTAAEFGVAQSWVKTHISPTSGTHVPFAFTYGGKRSTDLLSTWDRSFSTRPLDSGRTESRLSFTDPATKLVVTGTATTYTDFPAISWVVEFQNRSSKETPILEDLHALSAQVLTATSTSDPVLFHADGSHAVLTDFQPRQQPLSPNTTARFASFGGRSSDGSLPFFQLQHASGGAAVDIGWTGQWSAAFHRDSQGRLSAQAGMQFIHTKLLPGEAIRTPSILLLFWNGPDRTRGQNLHRRLLLEHFSPHQDGKPVIPPFAASPHGVVGFEKTTEANVLGLIQNIVDHKLRVDTWWIDAGWFTCADNWARYVGNPQPDPGRFPHGLKPISNAAHAAGMKFLLWFEPERVMPDTWVYNHHRDWLIAPNRAMPAELLYQFNDKFHLFNLGNEQALAWLTQTLSRTITEQGIDAFRNDFNMYPLSYWQANEPADRRGIAEIRYITGLYRLFDTLRAAHPSLLLDNCASGGRRIDIEMLRRSFVLTRSDYLWDPIGQQCHTLGLAQWIPITGIGAASLDAYRCRSGLGSHYSFAASYHSTNPADWASMARTLAEFRSTQPFFSGDFYPLTPYTTDPHAWIAWQFDRPDLGQGLIQAFRRQHAPQDSARYPLSGLDHSATYAITNLDDFKTQNLSGRILMTTGLPISLLTKPSAALLTYKKLKP